MSMELVGRYICLYIVQGQRSKVMVQGQTSKVKGHMSKVTCSIIDTCVIECIIV